MKFCNYCGGALAQRIPAGDSRLRHVCTQCHTVHYQNPRIVAGCLPIWENKILLCRRAIEPRRGFWTLPAGFMENGETIEQAAARETREEACAQVINLQLYALFDLPHINQVYMLFRGELRDGLFGTGEESLETALFEEADIPWSSLAFPAIARTLECYFADRRNGYYSVHHEGMAPMPER
ncbi:ADP-ribose pyrophosphatase YjhB (NUDIX family) [Pseudomonas duriflava]|uniref:ADP-ribose pyrophosphatase YjhB (NUDIX family) n=1 Tax=Pseudomonas duriflava TaxID=459528 RepID=A0A562QPS4_9PSED|nr:NUDIX hydrolase [Pseudomonas duriflava]TWI58734.1 ADP-ribose pyrophosphatase YjhB (NUDIX family) [Pseudomonas duriflava]